ncbi:MAG: thioredoxin-dependent thiol peroxidase [Chitinispirillia bacterium]|jgi:peroxiredoxin Q/BCP
MEFENSVAPEFCLKDQNDQNVSLKDLKGKFVVIYFYPKDNTSGCTIEANEFNELRESFKEKNTVILGISKDSILSHEKFAERQNLHITLLSDPDHSVIEKYGIWQRKKNYGKVYMGTMRTTFLVDPEGKIIKIWRKFKVKDHARTVLEAIPIR